MSADRELIERVRINVRKELVPIPGGDGPASYRSVTLSPYDMDRLLALASAGADANEATDEFNAGFECAKAGGKITDEPNHCPQDEWRNGFLCGDYERHAAAARLAGVEAGLEAGQREMRTAFDAAFTLGAQFGIGLTDDAGMKAAVLRLETVPTVETCDGYWATWQSRRKPIDAAAVAARGRG